MSGSFYVKLILAANEQEEKVRIVTADVSVPRKNIILKSLSIFDNLRLSVIGNWKLSRWKQGGQAAFGKQVFDWIGWQVETKNDKPPCWIRHQNFRSRNQQRTIDFVLQIGHYSCSKFGKQRQPFRTNSKLELIGLFETKNTMSNSKFCIIRNSCAITMAAIYSTELSTCVAWREVKAEKVYTVWMK